MDFPPRRALWLLAPAAASVAIILSSPAQYLGRQHDDLIYIIGSHALAGGGYRLFTSPGAPPLTMINPGFPLLLLPVTWLAGERFVFYQIFCAAILAASPWLLWLWLRTRLSPPQAALVCLLFGSSPLVLSQAGTVMSEAPFLLLSLALLMALDSPDPDSWAAGLLLGITQLRTAGIAIVPGVLARPLRRRSWARAARTLAPAAAGMILWSLWSQSVSGGVHKIQEFKFLYGFHPVGHALVVAADNARYYLCAWGSSFLPARWGGGSAAAALGAALSALSFRGSLLLLRKDASEPALWMLAATALMHAVWPWHYDRYLILPLPLLLWTAGRGLGRLAIPSLALLLAAQLGFQSRHWLGARTAWAKPELSETYSWLKSRAKPADVLISEINVRDGFYAAMPSLPFPPAKDPADLARILRVSRARFILWREGEDLGLSDERSAAIRLKLEDDARFLKGSRLFRLVYRNAREQSSVYEVR